MLFYFLLLNLVLWSCISLYLTINTSKIAFLKDQPLANVEPSLAVVIAVRNEEKHLREALSSVCAINYAALRIIVVDDRSTDQTSSILKELSIIHPQLVLEKITELPPKWLGKTHALYKGSEQVTEEWILFTDADVLFHPDALKKAMFYAISHKLDHLTILPSIKSRSEELNSVLVTFQLMLEINLRPWLARNPKSKASIGVGAFNLVRKRAYEQIGTHERIRLRPDDDLQLGKAIKMAGFKQDVLYGQNQVELEWYSNLNEFINGLMKNSFAAFDYQLYKAVGAIIGTLVFFALPIPLGLIFGDFKTIITALLILAVQLIFCLVRTAPAQKWWYSLTISFAGLLMAFIILKATFLTLKNKGIYWRDHFYSLKELKEDDLG